MSAKSPAWCLVGDFLVGDHSCKDPSIVPQVPPVFPSAVVGGPIWSLSNGKFDAKSCCPKIVVAQFHRGRYLITSVSPSIECLTYLQKERARPYWLEQQHQHPGGLKPPRSQPQVPSICRSSAGSTNARRVHRPPKRRFLRLGPSAPQSRLLGPTKRPKGSKRQKRSAHGPTVRGLWTLMSDQGTDNGHEL